MKKKRTGRKAAACCAAMLMAALLSGCMFISSPEDLYSLPKLPDEYVDLEQELASLVDSGYEYAAPTGGENIQMVQMVDIDSDGDDEAVVFLRRNTDPKPMKIYVFKQQNGNYRKAVEIEESAASIERVDYQDLNGDGNLEIVVGWRMMNTDSSDGQKEDTLLERTLTRVVSVYNLERYDCQKVLETNYNRYVIADLDNRGTPELICVVGGAGNCNAVMYRWNTGVMERMCTTRLSVPPALLDGTRVDGLTDGRQALFVTGVVDEGNRVTDILVWKNGTLVNCVMDEQSGSSRLVYSNSAIQARDINGDGALEIPISYELPKASEDAQPYWGIQWTAFSSDGEAHVEETTYHNLTDGWYLVLPESWKDVLTITNVTSTTGERAVTLGVYRGEEETPLEVLTIYTETGDSREYKATKGNRFVLTRQTTTVYAAECLPGYSSWSGAMSEDALKEAFHMIRTEWYVR